MNDYIWEGIAAFVFIWIVFTLFIFPFHVRHVCYKQGLPMGTFSPITYEIACNPIEVVE